MVEKLKAAWLDHKIQKWISRKLFVLGLATYFFQVDKLSGEQWVGIALAYVGIEGFAKIATLWKHGPQ